MSHRGAAIECIILIVFIPSLYQPAVFVFVIADAVIILIVAGSPLGKYSFFIKLKIFLAVVCHNPATFNGANEVEVST